MKRLIAAGAVAVVATVAIAAGLAVVDRSGSNDRETSTNAPTAAGTKTTAAFFANYVAADGRVVRHDEGGDTVSEGQAYAMLLAVTANDRARFTSVWTWTRQNLQRPDGLFSWRWRNGRVDDVNPASDADLDIAAALLAASSRFDDESLAAEANRIATAVIDHETVKVANRLVLVAGPWAVADRVVNPSYLARCDFDEFEQLTSDRRWQQLHTSSYELIDALVRQGLPPDWIVVDSNGLGRPIDGPEARQGSGRYGLDAARIPARLAGCDEGRGVAAALWPRLQSLERDGAALAYATDGRRLTDDVHPLGLVASALAADAADDGAEADRRMQAAQQLEDQRSTYYGSAWLALGATTFASADRAARVPRAAPRVGGLRFAALGATAQATTIPATPAPTTSASTTAPTTAPSTTRPAATTATATSQPSTTPTTATTSRPASTVTTRPTTTTTVSTTRPAPSASLDEPSGPDAGDLSAVGAPLPGLRREGSADLSQEPTRRRTGAFTIGGFSAVAVLGTWLGLRERRIVRRRPTGAPDTPAR